MFDLDGARKEGYSDTEITSHLQSQYPNFNIAGAIKEGYSLDEVVAHLQGTPIPEEVRNEPGLESGIQVYTKPIGTMTKAGYAGLADILNPQQAKANVEAVQENQPLETTEGKVGKFIGSLFTPEQIALQGGLGAVIEGLGFGTWVSGLLKSWGEEAAINAIGKVTALAKTLGADLDTLGQFLLKPITLGEKTFGPIVSATSTPKEMMETARAIQQAAGQQIGLIAENADTEIGKNVGALDWAGLQNKLAQLKEAAVGDIRELAEGPAKQYEAAIKVIDNFITKELQGTTETAFSDLSAIKTKIGNLVYKHGSPLESKAALQEVYQAINETLQDAAKKVGGETSQAYLQANEVYHKAIAVIDGLAGKITAAKNWSLAGVTGALTAATGMITHSPWAAASIPVAYMGTKMIANYGPQAIAAALTTAAPYVAPVLKAVVPTAANVISAGLQQ